ncbi:MAG: glycosyltransferase family 4 protein [Clostridia bacterium]
MKILYVTTVSSTTNFFISHVNMLIDQGHSVDFACNVHKPIKQSLLDRGCRVFQIDFSRSPLDLSNMRAYKEVKALIIREKYDIVHVHTPVAAAVTRLAIKNIPNIKVIYTAHGFHFYKGAPLKNWLLYYPIEKHLSKYTDVLITINLEDYERAKRKFKAKKIEYVPGVGIDINKFQSVSVDREKKRAELGIPKDAYVMLSVGELNENKNHSTVIKALKKVNNPNITYIICGIGPLKDKLDSLIEKLELTTQVKLLGYRPDIPEILKISDLFVFPSYREGLSVSLMEAMISGLPVICSIIRGNTDLIHEGKGGYLVEPNDIDGFASAIRKIISNQEKSKEFVQYNKERIIEFSDDRVLERMDEIYRGLI